MGWVINVERKNDSLTASDNQLLFNFLTILSTLLLLHVHDALGTCLWVTCWMRGKNNGLRAVVPAELLESSYVTRETMFHKKQPVRRVRVTLPHSHGVGVWCDEDRVGKMGASDEELMSSSLLWQCSWLSSIFSHACGSVIWGYLNVPPLYQKTANVTPQLKVAPVA